MPVPGGWDSSSTDALNRNNANAANKWTQGPSTFGISTAGTNTYPLGGAVSIKTYTTPNDSDATSQGVFPGWEISIENV